VEFDLLLGENGTIGDFRLEIIPENYEVYSIVV
jgi:hypothetical protein